MLSAVMAQYARPRTATIKLRALPHKWCMCVSGEVCWGTAISKAMAQLYLTSGIR